MSETIRLPGAPPIYGLRFRTFDPAADYPAMADVLNRAWKADGLEPAFTPEGIRAQDAAAGGFEPSTGRFVAEVNHEMIGVATVHATGNAAGERLYFHTFDLL